MLQLKEEGNWKCSPDISFCSNKKILDRICFFLVLSVIVLSHTKTGYSVIPEDRRR
jgi:hypothetical protein